MAITVATAWAQYALHMRVDVRNDRHGVPRKRPEPLKVKALDADDMTRWCGGIAG
jgi:hypothetical protein